MNLFSAAFIFRAADLRQATLFQLSSFLSMSSMQAVCNIFSSLRVPRRGCPDLYSDSTSHASAEMYMTIRTPTISNLILIVVLLQPCL